MVFVVLILCSIPFFRSYSLRDRPLEEDEIYWTGQAYYFHLAVEQHDWTNPDWQLLPSRENPVLGKYVIGLGLRLAGLQMTKPDWLGIFYIIAKDRPNAWGDAHDQAERRTVLDRMELATREAALLHDQFDYPIEYALTGRALMLCFGVVAVVLVFVLTALYTKPVTAFVAAVLFALHPAVVAAYTEVGVDILAMAFSLAAVISFGLIERDVWRRSARPKLYRALICGGGAVSVAFAVGSKMNAAVVGFLGAALALCFIASWLRRRSVEARDSAVSMILLLFVSLVVFVVTNPLNYPNPVAGIRAVYAAAQHSLEVQKGIPAVHHALRSGSERLHALAELTAVQPALFGLVVAAFVFLVVADRRAEKPMFIITLWLVIAVVMVTAWLPFARARYLLPVIAPSVILVCGAGERLVELLRRRKRATTETVRAGSSS